MKEQHEELKKEKATTPEGTILQGELKKLQVSNFNHVKVIKELKKNDEEQKTANTKLDKKVKDRDKALEEEKTKNDEKDAIIAELKRQNAEQA